MDNKMYKDGLKECSNYAEFGKLMINLKLLNNNVLLLKYKTSYAPVNGLRRTNISDDIKDILYYILDTKNLNYENIRDLEPNDNKLMINILTKSGLDVLFRLDKKKASENIEELIERFKIIQGEIGAGNNNPELLKDVKIILTKLLKHQKITQTDYEEMMNEIEELF